MVYACFSTPCSPNLFHYKGKKLAFCYKYFDQWKTISVVILSNSLYSFLLVIAMERLEIVTFAGYDSEATLFSHRLYLLRPVSADLCMRKGCDLRNNYSKHADFD